MSAIFFFNTNCLKKNSSFFYFLKLFFQGILKRKLDIIGTQISKNIKTIQKFQVSPISKIYFLSIALSSYNVNVF